MFLDGVGIGPPDPGLNPFLQARLPTLRALLKDQIPVFGNLPRSPNALCLPLDPLMGMPGLPQSGTGQVALLTGENAASLYGRHFGPWVPVPLRPLMMEKNVLTRARERGFSCVFANAYPSQYQRLAWSKRPAGPPLAAKGAGVFYRDEDNLANETAVSSEIINTAWRTRLGFTHLPEITPAAGGRTLAKITGTADLTFFAHYSTDTAGHERDMGVAVAALEKVDAFLAGLLDALPPATFLVMASDHGNIEDVSQGHTKNPVLGVVVGPGAESFAQGVSSITHIPDLILAILEAENWGSPGSRGTKLTALRLM